MPTLRFELAGTALIGLFFLSQTRSQPNVVMRLLCLVIWLTAVWHFLSLVGLEPTPILSQREELELLVTQREELEIIELIPAAPVVEIREEVEYVVVANQEGAASQVNWDAAWPEVRRWQADIEAAASECGVDAALITAMIMQESSGDPNLCSSAGACGLMQLMPATAREVGVNNRLDPSENVRGGACYMGFLLERYSDDLTKALAAYNAGPGTVERGGIPTNAETQLYLRNVPKYYQQLSAPAKAKPTVSFEWPTKGRITQLASAGHMALDIAIPIGTPIKASASGQVILTGWDEDGYGNYVILEHGSGYQTLYAHLSEFLVSQKEHVGDGDTIGLSGSTGRSTGPHLHFEIRYHGSRQNPNDYLKQE